MKPKTFTDLPPQKQAIILARFNARMAEYAKQKESAQNQAQNTKTARS